MTNSKLAPLATIIILAGWAMPGARGQTPVSSCAPLNQDGGSYVLTGPVVSTGGTVCLVIQADNVTLDLNGFGLEGPGSGTAISGGGSGAVIKNGSIKGFHSGVHMTSDGVVVENVRMEGLATASTGGGVNAKFGATVRDSQFKGFAYYAIHVGNGSIVERNLVRDAKNSMHGGIRCYGYASKDAGCIIRDNIVSNQTGAGIVITASASQVLGNEILSNVGDELGLGGALLMNHHTVLEFLSFQDMHNHI